MLVLVGIMEYLLSKGAQVDSKDSYGITPLLAAVYEGHDEGQNYATAWWNGSLADNTY